MFLSDFLCFGLLCAIVTVVHGAPAEDMQSGQLVEITDLATDLENWMAQLPSDLRNVPLNYLAIPGSHDSFTVDISKKSEVSPDGEDILRKLEFLKIVKVVMANWSKTQGFNVVQQLQAGIRFFDLRICRNSSNENLYFCHGMYSTEVKSVLSKMASYLESHPKEVVILDCQHFYNFTSETHAEVIQLLIDTFGSKLIPYQSSMGSLTLENLASQNRQVLAVYRDESQSNELLLWPEEAFPTPWYDTMDSNYLISRLNSGLNSRSPNIGYISQLVLTPSVNDIIKYVLSTLKQKCAIDLEDTRTNWIASQTPGQRGVNVIIADFIDLTDNTFSKTVINLNLKLDIAQLHSGGIFEKIKHIFVGIKEYIF